MYVKLMWNSGNKCGNLKFRNLYHFGGNIDEVEPWVQKFEVRDFGLFCWQIDDIVKAMGELSQKWKIVDEFLSWDIILRALWLETESIGEFCPMKGNAQALSIMTMKSQHGHWTIAWADLHLYYFVNAICFLVWINESLSLSLSLSHTHTHTHTHTHFFK